MKIYSIVSKFSFSAPDKATECIRNGNASSIWIEFVFMGNTEGIVFVGADWFENVALHLFSLEDETEGFP